MGNPTQPGPCRFTRLTNAFARKLEYHLYVVALHAALQLLPTPPDAYEEGEQDADDSRDGGGLAKRPWTVHDLLDLLDGR